MKNRLVQHDNWATPKHIYEPTVQADNENGREPIQVNIKENEAPQAPQDAPKPTEQTKPATNPAAAKKPAQATAAQPEPAKKKPGGHIEFTNKNVTPGDPQSYVYTVGQCPFYEMAGAKGCAPPSDIICNDDWTVCKPK